MFDREGKGFVSLADLQHILYNAFSMKAEDVSKLFEKVDANNDGLITFGMNYFAYFKKSVLLIILLFLKKKDEFKGFAAEKPEYARVFLTYHELKRLKSARSNTKLANIKEHENENISSDDDDDDQLFVSSQEIANDIEMNLKKQISVKSNDENNNNKATSNNIVINSVFNEKFKKTE